MPAELINEPESGWKSVVLCLLFPRPEQDDCLRPVITQENRTRRSLSARLSDFRTPVYLFNPNFELFHPADGVDG